jgi:hypothetical protein
MQKFQKTMDEYNIKEDSYDMHVIRGISEYYEKYGNSWSNPFDEGDWAGNYFDEKTVLAIWEKDPFATIVVKSEYGGDDDSSFSVYDDEGNWLDMDYDLVDLDWFSEFDQFMYSEADEKKHGVEILHSYYGAGRNG